METKPILKLQQRHKDFLDTISRYTKGVTKSTSDKDIRNIHAKITSLIASNSEIQTADINNLIINYKKSNDTISALKLIAKKHNCIVLSHAYKTPEWRNFLIEFSRRVKLHPNNIKDGFHKLMLNYIYTWDTILHIIIINKKGDVQNIQVIDPDDIEFILKK